MFPLIFLSEAPMISKRIPQLYNKIALVLLVTLLFSSCFSPEPDACCRFSPHISGEGCRPAQQSGRSGRPKIRQRNWSSRWRHGSPAGLCSEEIDGAMQQAPQPGRHSIGGCAPESVFSDMGHCRRFRFWPFFRADRSIPKKGAEKRFQIHFIVAFQTKQTAL